MNISICDDNENAVSEITEYLTEYFSISQKKAVSINAYSNGIDLLESEIIPDILFLDIRMPGIDGIHIGKTISERNVNCIIIITSSHMEYLDDAMRFHVFRYLSKPLNKNRFFKNLEDALQAYHSRTKKICIETKNEILTVFASDLIMIEARGRIIDVYTTNGIFRSIHRLSYWIKNLDMPCFYQPHKSFIINLEHISSFNHVEIYLYNNTLKAYLTRRKYVPFKQHYLLYLESMR